MNMVEVKSVSKIYKQGNVLVHALDHVSLRTAD